MPYFIAMKQPRMRLDQLQFNQTNQDQLNQLRKCQTYQDQLDQPQDSQTHHQDQMDQPKDSQRLILTHQTIRRSIMKLVSFAPGSISKTSRYGFYRCWIHVNKKYLINQWKVYLRPVLGGEEVFKEFGDIPSTFSYPDRKMEF